MRYLAGSVYVDGTKRLISTRLKEQIRITMKEDVEKSAMAENSTIMKGQIIFYQIKTLANIPFHYKKSKGGHRNYQREGNFKKEDSIRLSRT